MEIGNLKVYGIIYKITNKINGKVYIGQTTDKKGFDGRYPSKGNDIERIFRYHKKLNKNNNDSFNRHIFDSIKKYGFDCFEVVKTFDIAFSKEELDIKEMCWINYFDAYKNGYNKNFGGSGNKGHKNSLKGKNNPRSRKIVQLNLQGQFIKTWNCIMDVERECGFLRSCINSACIGSKKSAYNFMWMYYEDYELVKKDGLEYKNEVGQYSKRKVIQLTLNGEYLNAFNSITEASMSDESFSAYEISACCRKSKKSHKGFMWIYKEDYDNGNIPIYNVKNDRKPKEVIQLTINKEYINEFESIAKAGKVLKLIPSDITRNCKHKGKSVGGYIFMYKEEYNKIFEAM